MLWNGCCYMANGKGCLVAIDVKDTASHLWDEWKNGMKLMPIDHKLFGRRIIFDIIRASTKEGEEGWTLSF